MVRHLIQSLLAVLLLLAAPLPAAAELPRDIVSVNVLPGWREADGRHVAGVEISLAPGWLTYWRSPGDAGIPPQFSWDRSRNLHSVVARWPVPELFRKNGMVSIGYTDSVIVPLILQARRPGADIALAGAMDIGVCSDVCVPVRVPLRARLSAASGRPDPRIVAALADRPETAGEARAGQVTCRITPIDGGLRLSAEVEMPAMAGDEHAVVELTDPAIWVGEVDTTRQGNRLTATTDMYAPDGLPFLVDRSGLRMTVFGNGRVVDLRGCISG